MTRRLDDVLPGAGRADLVPLGAVVAGLVLLTRSPGLLLAGAGAALILLGAWLSPRAGLVGVVLTLPFYLFARDLGGQSVSPTEAAILLTAAAVGIRGAMLRWRGRLERV